MASEWKECTLAELGEIVGGATPSTKDESNYGGDIAWITPKDLSALRGRFIAHGERNITEKGLNSCSTQMMPTNAVLFSSRAPIGYVAIAKNPVCTNQGFKSIVANADNDPMFLYYLLKYNKDAIEAMGSGTTFKEVSGSTMRSIRVRVPESKVEQQRIASVLAALDSKIENNDKINDNLEQQAQLLFQSWFVDFSSAVECEMVDSEIGKIPRGWRVYRLSEFLPVITGKKNANVSSDKGEYPFFSCSQDFSWTDDYSFEGHAILVAGNGDFNVKWYKGKFEAYQRTYVLIPHEERYTSWLYYAVKYNLARITSAARGSVIKFITKGNLEDFAFAAPSDLCSCEIIDTFAAINRKIDCLTQENYRLSSIRDTLLPRLMSGKIDVSDISI